jgi:hemerythrin
VQECLAGAEQDTHRAAWLLAQLYVELRTHFEHEERGGYFDDLIARAPQLKPMADRVIDEHPILLRCVETMRDQAETAAASNRPTPWNHLRQLFEEFRNRFRLHEASENQLVREAYYRDMGAED